MRRSTSLRGALRAGLPALQIWRPDSHSLLLHLVPGGAGPMCAPWQVEEQATGTVWRCCWLHPCHSADPTLGHPKVTGSKKEPFPTKPVFSEEASLLIRPTATGTTALPISRGLLCPSVWNKVPCIVASTICALPGPRSSAWHRPEGAISQWDRVS